MTVTRSAMITGATGQDGVYLTELLLAQGYEVSAVISPRSPRTRGYVDRFPSARVWQADVRDGLQVLHALRESGAAEVYNLAARSSVADSWGHVDEVMAVNAVGPVNLLNAIVQIQAETGTSPRYYQASSSEMFGTTDESPQRESTAFHPRSPYGVSKVAAHFLTMNFRESYGLFACSGILFNHESPLRPQNFVTRKVTSGVAAIATGQLEYLTLGNLDVSRDWGYAPDYVRAMWLMMQAPEPEDIVVATGVAHSLRDLLDIAFASAGIGNWQRHVRHDPSLMRPADVAGLVGDPSRAKERLGWEPSITFEQMIREMVEFDLSLAETKGRSADR